MYRESDLIDVWFDSGSMPYAQLHYPFEGEMARGTEADREALIHSTYEGYAIPPKFYPADFINERGSSRSSSPTSCRNDQYQLIQVAS